jgi:hypothetical protein
MAQAIPHLHYVRNMAALTERPNVVRFFVISSVPFASYQNSNLKWSHEYFPPHCFHSIAQKSPYHSKLRNLTCWQYYITNNKPIWTCTLLQAQRSTSVFSRRNCLASTYKTLLFYTDYKFQFIPKIKSVRRNKGKVRSRTGHEGPVGEWKYSPTLSLTSALDGVGG